MPTAVFMHTVDETRREELITHQLMLRHLMRAVVTTPDDWGESLVQLERFRDYFESMVVFEESLMSQSGYPDLEDHHQQHATLVRELGELLHRETTTQRASGRLADFLVRLRIHLYRADGLFAHHLIVREGIGRADPFLV